MNLSQTQENQANVVIPSQTQEQKSHAIVPNVSHTVTLAIPISVVPIEDYNNLLRENKELRDELSRYKSENISLKATIDGLHLTIKELQEENERLKRELAEIKEELEKHKKQISYLMNDKVQNLLLGATVDIIKEENLQDLFDTWEDFKDSRNELSHYLYRKPKNKPYPLVAKYEQYELFIRAYENNKELLILDELDPDNNTKLVELLISKIRSIIADKSIDKTTPTYKRTEKRWCL